MTMLNAMSASDDITLEPSQPHFGFTSHLDAPMRRNLDADLTAMIPDVDDSYYFDPETTEAILAGFLYNRRVLIQGYHGTGKSSHIEQVASRLSWPCVRINLDGHINRLDLVGRDAIVLQDGKQVTTFKQGLLPWAMQQGVALVFDEYDAGRPDVMFVLQRVLENNGKLTLTEQNTIIRPHPLFRMFATSNTLGLGDAEGIYHGTNPINHGQMDRWNIVAQLNYLPQAQEEAIILRKMPQMANKEGKQRIASMVAFAGLTRHAFKNAELSTVMSPRSVLLWAENYVIFNDVERALRLTFIHKCDQSERAVLSEFYQRCFGQELSDSQAKQVVG